MSLSVLYVANRRTVIFEGNSYGPGDIVNVSGDEAEHFMRSGFLQNTPPDLPNPSFDSRSNPERIGLQQSNLQDADIQGPRFR